MLIGLPRGQPTLVGASTGLVVGLVAITPGAGFVPIWAAIIIGLLVSPICYYGTRFIKQKLNIDDALDAFGCHGIGGIWGGIATGLFAQTSINSAARWERSRLRGLASVRRPAGRDRDKHRRRRSRNLCVRVYRQTDRTASCDDQRRNDRSGPDAAGRERLPVL